MYSWIDSSGQTIKTKTVKEFSALTGMRESNAISLAAGPTRRSVAGALPTGRLQSAERG